MCMFSRIKNPFNHGSAYYVVNNYGVVFVHVLFATYQEMIEAHLSNCISAYIKFLYLLYIIIM